MLDKIKKAKVIFWDFDGVIKDSVFVKTQAYEKLFEEYGQDIKKKVVKHHEENGGMSRYEKFPFYFKEYIGHELVGNELEDICEKFSNLVLDKVIKSPWVPGVKEYLNNNLYNQKHVVVTGTPQSEIEIILDSLDLIKNFSEIWGAPNSKEAIIKNFLIDNDCLSEQTLMIGDSSADWNAARANNVPFVLRRTKENIMLQNQTNIECINDFNFHGVSV